MSTEAQADSPGAQGQVLVWDLPTRIFHWVLVGCFVGALALAETAFLLHVMLGLIVAFAAVLRILWGLFGSRYARFSAFSLGPKALAAYFRGLLSRTESTSVQHNPASSWVTIVMLLASLGLALTGIIMSRGGAAKAVHEALVATLVVSAALHVVGVIWQAWRQRDGIALSMFFGRKAGPPAAGLKSSYPAAAAAFVVLIGAFGGLLLAGYDPQTEQLTLPATGWIIKGETHSGQHERGHGRSSSHADGEHESSASERPDDGEHEHESSGRKRHDDTEHEHESSGHERHHDD